MDRKSYHYIEFIPAGMVIRWMTETSTYTKLVARSARGSSCIPEAPVPHHQNTDMRKEYKAVPSRANELSTVALRYE